RWGILRHDESDDPRSILAKGQFITDAFDESKAVDFALRPGEMVLFDNTLVHGSGTNLGPDRRFLLLVEMLPAWAKPPRVRQAAMLMRGMDTSGNFDDEPRPDAEWSETAVANWSAVVNRRAQLIFADSKVGPSEAYGGTRAAT
ncbi:MAG: phytanoyl-CoA dioxygenase family protein, partial [Candidatus Rokuibacteriota bacterium]